MERERQRVKEKERETGSGWNETRSVAPRNQTSRSPKSMLPPRSSSFWSSLLWWISSFSTWLIDDQTCWASTRPRADPPLASRLLFLFPIFEHDVWGQGILLFILLRGRQDNYPFPLTIPALPHVTAWTAALGRRAKCACPRGRRRAHEPLGILALICRRGSILTWPGKGTPKSRSRFCGSKG